MDGRNDRAIAGALEEMAHVIGHAIQVLQANQNKHGVVDEFCGLEGVYKSNLPSFKGMYNPEGTQS